MVGRKSNLNILVSELWNVGATVVKTTEFVQGRTSRWGLAWSFLPPLRKMISSQKPEENNNLSFTLEVKFKASIVSHHFTISFCLFTLSGILMETSSHMLPCQGIQREHGAFHVLQAVESYFANCGASCKLDAAAFHVDVRVFINIRC